MAGTGTDEKEIDRKREKQGLCITDGKENREQN